MRMTMFLVVVLVASSASAQSVPPDLQKAMDARRAALQAGDEQTWGRYTTDDFMVVGATGLVTTKTARMAEIKGNKPSAPTRSEVKTRLYGDTAIQTLLSESDSGRVRIIDVWVKQGGQWRVAAVQLSSVEK